ncbi:MAG: ATP-dependent RecD-like DNA helicase [Christensenellaceae bacterium]|nr:ATP-dependent RecD-like DNA helicase [Christensenellaceae bacterium]
MTFIEGTVLEIIFRNSDNGYTVLEADCDGKLVTCVGSIPFIQPGEYVRFYGAYTTHKTYGDQFKVASMESRLPEEDESIRLFLSGGLIKGIGEILADRIVNRFHEDTFNILENHPHELATIKGISMNLALKIQAQIVELTSVRSSIIALQSMGLSVKQAFAAYEAYGAAAADVIKQNPYKLIDDVYGIGFERADAIAERLGIEKYSDFRAKNGIRHILKKQMEEFGHTCLPRETLKKYACELLEIDDTVAEETIDGLLLNGTLSENIYNETQATALYSAYRSESYCAYRLVNMANSETATQVDPKVIDKVLSSSNLSEAQEMAVITALSGCVSIITGGPGTGKTTILNQLITILEKSGLTAALAAPTGRAAKRMEKATMRRAQTIHRLLEYGMDSEDDKGGRFRFRRDEDNPIEADAVIIDETSMVDIYLMESLLRAIAPGTRLIFTGDADQLPSVGPGNVLKDMISAGIIPVFRLTEVFRQKGNIALNAHKVNRGEKLDLFPAGDFVFIPADSSEDTLAAVKKLYIDRINDGVSVDEIQVICPIKRGLIGVQNLNNELRELINPRLADKSEAKVGETTFRAGDKVMQTSNNYAKEWHLKDTLRTLSPGTGVFNGDMGFIMDIDAMDLSAEILFDDDRIAEYELNELNQIEHAYAVTVHKSQGSEFDTVILPLYYGATPFLTRNLFYTAITRAKRKLFIIGSKRTIDHMIQNSRISHRFTGLKYEMLEAAKVFDGLGEGSIFN